MKKNLQNKTKIAIIIIAMLLVSGQLVFGVELKKKDLWENGIGYGTFKLIKHSDLVKEKILSDYHRLSTEFYPLKYHDYTVYGYYGSINIFIFKNQKLGKAFLDYQDGKIKANKTVRESSDNNIVIFGSAYYDDIRGYIYDFMVENWFGAINGFEDMVIGFVDLSKNEYISENPIKTTYKPVVEGYEKQYNGSNYCSEFILTIPKDFQNWEHLALYISNNYIPGMYVEFNENGKWFGNLSKSYTAYLNEIELNKLALAKYEILKKEAEQQKLEQIKEWERNEKALILAYKTYAKEATAMGIKNAYTKSMNWLYRYVTQNRGKIVSFDFILSKDGNRMVDIDGRKIQGYTLYCGYGNFYILLNGKKLYSEYGEYIHGASVKDNVFAETPLDNGMTTSSYSIGYYFIINGKTYGVFN